MSRTQAEDLAIGAANETVVLPQLARLLNTQLKKHSNEMWAIDFHNEDQTVWAETKRRFCNRATYPDVMVGKNKVDFCTDPSKDYYFSWNYDDGFYYIKYDKTLFDTFEIRPFQRTSGINRRDRETHCVWVPTSLLTKIEA